MTALDSTQRADAAAKMVLKFFVEQLKTADLDTSEVLTLIGACDDWADTNQAAFNSSLPVAIRNKASTQTKTAALAMTILKRAGMI